MLISIDPKKLNYKGRAVIMSFLPVDLTSIFKRDWSKNHNPTDYSAMVYIWVKPHGRCKIGHSKIKIKGTPFYVGSSKHYDVDKLEKSRANTHDNDSLSEVIEEGDICYIIGGLSPEEARCLEAHLINALGLPLSKRGCHEYKPGTLVNKRYEWKNLNLVDTYNITEWKLHCKSFWKVLLQS